MGNMEGFGVFLWNAVITLFCFFALAPIVLSAISTFGVQKRFAQTMVDEGVISRRTAYRYKAYYDELKKAGERENGRK